MKIFSSALFGPVQYFTHLASVDEAIIETDCNYSRQTYRNRFVILGANGVIPLTVPVEKVHNKKTVTRDVKIAYETPWQDLQWKSIVSAYNSSPYFLYYRDEFEPIFQKKWKYLLDLNMASTELAKECIDIDTKLVTTKDYYSPSTTDIDLRDLIHPKRKSETDLSFQPSPYRQVFNLGGEFIPNLSIIDLIFNKGPEALLILRDSLVT